MSTFLLEIITPDRVAYSDQVNMVTAPSAAGEVGILPQHEPLFSRLIEGELKIKKDKEETFLAIGGGFLDVTKDKTVVLVTEAVHADEINEKEMLEARARAEKALKDKPQGEALRQAQQLFTRSNIALKVLTRRKKLRV
ncbi:ATP synthase F1 subunit epsilon [Candidatus Gottesmanbacteria bacterium RIFCSPHIGHO2_01_FULL_39_10]|uniref:ATP synthase epsilon chain n=1 Tax=Candidatus Gottesmanbacteria bacterium RIFCSPHIGHO2_01_FULL_39_10 TaxID=1798375 RepID=A0A1F5ZKU1_9BACT|nr:MAG: ATP synthase F1 subunit epsilon [Candidatus Gottesmanbacteria bacterium RIFCSPHIGHO2_01_FULL_39_10]